MVSYYGGASLVLLSVHARALTADTPQHQMVLDVINEMALAARMPVPKAYMIDDPSPNAFATGRDPAAFGDLRHAGAGRQDGSRRVAGRDRPRDVARRDYDIRTMMMIAVMVAGIAMLSDFVYRWMFYGRFRRRRRQEQRRRDNDQAATRRADRIR